GSSSSSGSGGDQDQDPSQGSSSSSGSGGDQDQDPSQGSSSGSGGSQDQQNSVDRNQKKEFPSFKSIFGLFFRKGGSKNKKEKTSAGTDIDDTLERHKSPLSLLRSSTNGNGNNESNKNAST
ncbi:hypothetical protein FG386_002425, partial [Cryptosporidium ryanae]|uniref:uncharacterized protein n=1 Tax=Cryptosporidium ryanae TaxID=515981 RepID=UPI00351A5863